MKRRILLREPIGVALETLRAHKMRSFLMLLGIILSVSTLIVVIALISGVNRYIADRVANLGSNVFRSEEHTSELQSRLHLVCRLLLEKKKKIIYEERICRVRD